MSALKTEIDLASPLANGRAFCTLLGVLSPLTHGPPQALAFGFATGTGAGSALQVAERKMHNKAQQGNPLANCWKGEKPMPGLWSSSTFGLGFRLTSGLRVSRC